MENKQIKLELVAERKTFVDQKTGETRKYVSLITVIEGQPIKLAVSQDSKQLFNYLFDKNYK